MNAYVVTASVPASKQHSAFLAIRAVFSTQDAADAWVKAQPAKAPPCAVHVTPLDPETPAPDASLPACADVAQVKA